MFGYAEFITLWLIHFSDPSKTSSTYHSSYLGANSNLVRFIYLSDVQPLFIFQICAATLVLR